MTLNPIGKTFAGDDGFGLTLDPKYRKALQGLEGFSYVQVLWWFSQCDNEADRSKLLEAKPYQKAPAVLGTFATRSPQRPNPIAVTTAYVLGVDVEGGTVHLAWLDAFDGSPVLDLKPYTPSADRVECPQVPQWCSHWPGSVETSGEFDWEQEFLF